MNRGASNGRVGSMQQLLKAKWQTKVVDLATIVPGQTCKVIPLVNGKANNVPFEQIIERAKVMGIHANVKESNLYLAPAA